MLQEDFVLVYYGEQSVEEMRENGLWAQDLWVYMISNIYLLGTQKNI